MRKYVFALMALLTPVLLSVPAFASDFAGDREGEVGGGRYTVSTLVKAMHDVANVMEQVWIVMVSNPFLVVLVAAGLFTVGVRIFRKTRRAAKG